MVLGSRYLVRTWTPRFSVGPVSPRCQLPAVGGVEGKRNPKNKGLGA